MKGKIMYNKIMYKLKTTKRYFNNQVVIIRESFECDFVVERFYYKVNDDNIHDIERYNKETPLFTIRYSFVRENNNQKLYHHVDLQTPLATGVWFNISTSRLDTARNIILKYFWDKITTATIATGYVLNKRVLIDE